MIQIDIKMPSCCIDCPLYDCRECGECKLIPNSRSFDGDGYDPFEERHKDCPIKEEVQE